MIPEGIWIGERRGRVEREADTYTTRHAEAVQAAKEEVVEAAMADYRHNGRGPEYVRIRDELRIACDALAKLGPN